MYVCIAESEKQNRHYTKKSRHASIYHAHVCTHTHTHTHVHTYMQVYMHICMHPHAWLYIADMFKVFDEEWGKKTHHRCVHI